MTAPGRPRKPPRQPNARPPEPDRPLVSLRTFVLITAALMVAVGAGACVYWHKQWLIVGAAAFASSLVFFNRFVKSAK